VAECGGAVGNRRAARALAKKEAPSRRLE
jgi:hypothetical protein